MDHKPTSQRPARFGEICSCGRPAIKVFLEEDLGPVPFCGVAGDAHKPGDCPSWCAEGHHLLPFDRLHDGESHEVELEAHPYQNLVNGEWQAWRQPLLVGLTKEPGSKPAYIEITGVDEKLAGRLTAYEAEQLAGILHGLAATLRREEAERLASEFTQAVANGYAPISLPST